MIAVVKIGTSSITGADGAIDDDAIRSLTEQVVAVRRAGHQIVLVTSGAIAAGLPALGFDAESRPTDAITLQAIASVGQVQLMTKYTDAFAELGELVAGQVLLSPLDFGVREQYLHARATLERLLELGVVPIVNENDTVADDEIRLGDNDRIAALVAQLVGAEMLMLLTDAPGVLTADPSVDSEASLIEEILQIDRELEAVAGGAGSARGSGGMATKIGAAKIAAATGVRTVIAAASRPDVVRDALDGVAGVGTVVQPRDLGWSARKVWIAFARHSEGALHIDEGAAAALGRGSSLLRVGVTDVVGTFDPGAPVDVVGTGGQLIARGLARHGSSSLRSDDPVGVCVHRDDLVMFDEISS